VIEAQQGVEEFDARDRALVWRTMGGKHRYLIGEADVLASDHFHSLRAAVAKLLGHARAMDLSSLQKEHAALGRRLQRFGNSGDALDIWGALGVAKPGEVPMMEPDAFIAMATPLRERADG
jgi:malonate decarboxylase beta subunit